MSVRHANRALLMSGLAGALLLLPACGGSSDASPGASTAPAVAASGSPAGGAAGFEAYRSCMADNGVPLGDGGAPDGGFPSGMPSSLPSGMPSGMPSGGRGQGGFPGGSLPDGVDQETFDAAQAACVGLMPQGGPAAGVGRPDETAVAAFRSCLIDHDVTVPEGEDWLADLDRSDAGVAAAMETCAPLLPSVP
ncbi:MAG: hypothetical protein Q7V58_15605 [Actinomycetota bacterium]|nr:hypothetical protein [Actinomycetota bacterium]